MISGEDPEAGYESLYKEAILAVTPLHIILRLLHLTRDYCRVLSEPVVSAQAALHHGAQIPWRLW